MLRMLAGEAARRHGKREAFVGGGRRLGFADLDRFSDAVAAGLAHRGVLPGDVVAIALPPIPEYAVCSLAIAKLGAVAAGYDPGLPAESLARLHDVIRPCLTIAARGVWLSGELVTVDSARPPSGDTLGRTLGRLARPEPPPPPLPPDPYRPVMIVTSGPPDEPRGAIFGDRQLETIRRTESGTRWGGGEPRLLGAAYPEFLTRLACVLQSGTTVYTLPSAVSAAASGTATAVTGATGSGGAPDAVADEIRATAEFGLTTLTGTAERLRAVLAHPLLPELDFTALREIVLLGPASQAAALVQALRERFQVPVRAEYRPAEAGLGVGTSRDAPPEDAEITVGRPVAGVTLAIRDAAGRAIGTGETGEVLLRSGAVMSGYWNDPVATAQVITKDGFVRTGDHGWIDTAGRLHLSPR
jgi:long-chain acyl-CoA synthetase